MSNRCENCEAPLSGTYCASCGQSGADFDLPIKDFAKEFASETLALDGRLHLTLWPLFARPGEVATDYVSGRRARFVPPVRLYVFASFLMFLILALGPGPTVQQTVTEDGSPLAPDSLLVEPDTIPSFVNLNFGGGAFGESLQRRLVRGSERISDDREGFVRDLRNGLAKSMFFLLPAFALLLKIAYRRRLYVHHIVFSIYFHSFVFLVVGLVALPEAMGLGAVTTWLEFLLLGVPVYLAIAMKRFYEETWPWTLLKFIGVSWTYSAIGAATMLGVLVFSLLSA